MGGLGGGTRRDPAAGMGLHGGVLRVGQGAAGMPLGVLRRTPVVGAGQGHTGTRAHTETTPVTPLLVGLGARGA